MDLIEKLIQREDRLRPPSPTSQEAPWLIYTHGTSKQNQIQTFCTLSPLPPHNTSYIKSIPDLRRKSICGSCHGWLILRDSIEGNQFSLFDLLTLQSLVLPPLPDAREGDGTKFTTCTLTSPPYSQGCVLFLFFENQIFSCRPTSKDEDGIGTSNKISCSWVSQRVEFDGKKTVLYSAVPLNGFIYCRAHVFTPNSYGCRVYLVSMKVEDEPSNKLTNCLQLFRPDGTFDHFHCWYYLVESCSHIYWVFHYTRCGDDSRINNVEIWEVDLLLRKLEPVNCLGGRAFFIGPNCSTWCWPSSTVGGIQGNCVYFLVPDNDNKIFYSYNLDDKSLTLFQTLPMQTPYNAPVWVNVMPQHQRLLPKFQIGSSIQPHENERKDSKNLFAKLPTDMLWLILKHMHLFDYWNFRASCKTFQSAVPPTPQWRANNLLPLFVFFNSDSGLCQVLDPYRDDSHSNILQVSSHPFTVDFSKDGWIVMCLKQAIKFFNPFTRVMGDFPPIEYIFPFEVRSIGFSTNLTSSDCLTVAFEYNFEEVVIYYLRYGDETWSRCDFDHEEDMTFNTGTSSPVYFAGAFYVLSRVGYLGEFKLTNGTPSWRVYDCPVQDINAKYHSCHLVECGGQLLAVYIGYMGRWIQVFNFINHSNKQWVQVESLGNYSLFINHSTSFSKEIPKGMRMRNRIYISRLYGNSIIFYSFETRRFHISNSDSSWEDFSSTKEPLRCCWI